MSRPPKNMAISVRDRLTARARERRENAQLLMTRYVIERLLFRLSLSPHRERFVLKGAMLFSLWADDPYRATGDLDLLGMGENAPEQLAAVFQEILGVAVDDDGIVFRSETLRAAAAHAEDDYAGVPIAFVAELAGARLPMHVDIGFGDAITPGAIEIEYRQRVVLDRALFGMKSRHPAARFDRIKERCAVVATQSCRRDRFIFVWRKLGFAFRNTA